MTRRSVPPFVAAQLVGLVVGVVLLLAPYPDPGRAADVVATPVPATHHRDRQRSRDVG